MRNLLYKRVVIFFLVFCLCAVMPQYTQAEETAVPAGEQETTVPEPITKTKTVKTAFSGIEKKHNYSISATIKDGISVTHPQGRKLYLQRYDSKNKKWVNAMTYSLNVQDAPQSVKVTYPAEWKKATYTSWRFYVPETTVSDAVIDNTTGQVTTTVMKYQAAASKTVRIIAANRVKLKLSCKRAVVMDQDGNILYTKNGSQRCSQASVTIIRAIGGYSGTEKTMMICVVNPHQIKDFLEIIHKYPGTFACVSDVTSTIGNFKHISGHKK